MKTNWNKEEVNGLLDEFVNSYKADARNAFNLVEWSEQFKKDKGLLPTLEEDTWVSWSGNSPCIGQIMGNQLAEKNCYVLKNMIGGEGIYDSCNILYLKVLTHEEVETALITQWEKDNEPFNHYAWHYANDFGMKGMLIGWNGRGVGAENTTLFDNGTWFPIEDTQLDKLEKKYKELGEEIQNLKTQ